MPNKKLQLEIVTPKKVIYNSEIQSVRAPGFIGSFQVLQDHAPLVSIVDSGEVKVIDEKGTDIRFAISGGFLDVRKNIIKLLAETAERADQIDVDRAEQARKRAKNRLVEKKVEIDIERAELALHRAVNRLKVAGRDSEQ